MKEEYMILVLDYLEGRISPEDEIKLKSMVQSGEISREEVNSMQDFYLRSESFATPQPSESLSDNFYQALHDEEAKLAKKNRWQEWLNSIRLNIKLPQLTYGLIIFLLGLLIGQLNSNNRNYDRQMSEMKAELRSMQESMVVNLLEQPSATQRLKAVSMSTGLQQTNERVSTSLLQVLNEDPHVNVRLAALDALLIYANQPQVREGLIRSIPGQEAPMVQLALAEAMVTLQEKRSVDELKELLEKKGLNEMVAHEIEKSIQVLI